MPGWTQPYYTVRVKSIACHYELLINGFPLDRHDGVGNISCEIPFNPFAFTGKNELEVTLRPGSRGGFHPTASFEAIVCGREDSSSPEQAEPIAGFLFKAAKLVTGTGLEETKDFGLPTGPRAIRVDDTTVRVERTIELQTPFPRWAWMDAPSLERNPETRASLLAEYQRFHQLLADGDRIALEQITAVRAHETALAYYVGDEEGVRMVGVADNIDDPQMTLLGFDRELRLEVIAGGRCARLVTDDHDSPIVYSFSGEPGMGMSLAMSFCRELSGAWLQIR